MGVSAAGRGNLDRTVGGGRRGKHTLRAAGAADWICKRERPAKSGSKTQRTKSGRCGRHVSLWKASWLGRRVGWGDDANRRDLYFAKAVTIADDVLSARACIAAVNAFTLYINGREIARRESGGQPRDLDISGATA